MILLAAEGFIQVRAYTSSARIPIQDATISITDKNGTGIAMRLTNRNGMLDAPVSIPVPDLSASQTPNTGIIPFTSVDLYARAENYELIEVRGLQVFANTLTIQDLALIPLSELPDSWNKAELFDTPAQNL